ncbi:MAG: GtrA family protein [Candidatus Nanopelagicales bacterium]|nr:GtrA family protein [Candidatus Nanopelagicales bacterium]MCF8539460.1 GtrA family protein [Candidatus Nanopelagicales bacterium]MCF8551730.1 GtrA family protein [Candidatus Nanopelagicales bacterium]
MPRLHFVTSLRQSISGLWREIAKFGIVGLSALVVDIGLFNLLRFSGPDGQGPMYDRPISSKIISVAVATTFAYFGNRYWTFRHRGRRNMGREYLLFFGLNGIAMLIAVGCLWFSHYLMGWDSALADNISANVVGLGLGTLFRFWSYRKFVFPAIPDDPEHSVQRELAERDASTPI